MQLNRPDISIVIPALNEGNNLKLLLPRLGEVITTLGITSEIIIVDGGSSDGSRKIAEDAGAAVVNQSERGYGGALLAGFSAARAPYVVTMDADLSHPPVFIKDFWRQRADAQVLIASRYVSGGNADMGSFRYLLSVILNKTYGRVLELNLSDLSSGFRMYQRSMLEDLDFQARDFDAVEEILFRIHLRGGRIKEVPFHYQPRHSGKSHARVIRFGWSFSKTLVRLRRLRNAESEPMS
jgi:dolichol-phosphate mannosyltransferase